MRLGQAIHDFISALELTDAERSSASRQHKNLREQLSRRLTLNPDCQTFLTGSYGRRTAIRPLDDIDMFCVLDGDYRHMSPREAQCEVKRALDASFPGKAAEPRARAVKIEFSGTGIAYDVVPAFAEPAGHFRIPDRQEDRWIKSNPKEHADLATNANRRTESELKPLTKAVKHWNKKQSERQRLRSFHLEVMAWSVITAKPANRACGLVDLFKGLAHQVKSPTPDPAGLGPAIDEGWSDRDGAASRLNMAATEIEQAIRLDDEGATAQAHHILRKLFGDAYPERGAP